MSDNETKAETPVASGGFDFDSAQVQKVVDEGAGAWMHICHPVSGEPLYDDDAQTKPCRVKVLSVDSKQFANATRAMDIKLLRDAPNMSTDEARDTVLKRAAASITAFENVRFQGRYLDGGNKADKLLWVGLAPDFPEQVRKFAGQIDHFFGSGSGN